MEIKISVPLISKISAIFSKTAPDSERPKRREDTTESSLDVGVASYYYKKVKLERTRRAKYGDYMLMDEEHPELSTALDLYADNATKEINEDGDIIEVRTDNTKVRNIISDLIDRTKFQQTLWDTARQMAKMSDDFDEVIVDDRGYIIRLKNLGPETIFKEVDEFGREKKSRMFRRMKLGIQRLLNSRSGRFFIGRMAE